MSKKFWLVMFVILGISMPLQIACHAPERGETGKKEIGTKEETGSEGKIGWEQVPDVVRSTIEKRAAGGKITEIVKKMEDGKAVYEFEVQTADGEMDYRVSPDGTFMGMEDDAGNITGSEVETEKGPAWVDSFSVDERNFSSVGKNEYFILEPGYQLALAGEEDGEKVELTITVLNETKKVGKIETRIVEEREAKGGVLAEVSRNYFAVDRTTGDVYYFGEDVDMYRDGKIINHEGAWLSGKDGARYGLAMPGKVQVGYRHYQEIAPKVAMDRAEIVSISETLKTPAGTFERCLKTLESSGLNPNEREYKLYAPGIGIIQDKEVMLIRHGFVGR